MELLAVLVIMATLSIVGVVSYTKFAGTTKAKADTVMLSIVQLEVRRLVTEGVFPQDIATSLPVVADYAYVSQSVSPSAGQVSLFRVSDTVMVYTTAGADGCVVVVDRLIGQSSWFIDEFSASLCSAEYSAGVALALPPSGSSTALTRVVLNA